MVKRDRADYQKQIIQGFRHKPKLFYHTWNMQTVKASVTQLKNKNSKHTTCDLEAENALFEYYRDLFTKESDDEDTVDKWCTEKCNKEDRNTIVEDYNEETVTRVLSYRMTNRLAQMDI